MRGEYVTIPDIVLESLILPANLVCNESLSPDEEPEEEHNYKVDSTCYRCGARLRVCVAATTVAIRKLQLLLLSDLHLLCPPCAREVCENGRQH